MNFVNLQGYLRTASTFQSRMMRLLRMLKLFAAS